MDGSHGAALSGSVYILTIGRLSAQSQWRLSGAAEHHTAHSNSLTSSSLWDLNCDLSIHLLNLALVQQNEPSGAVCFTQWIHLTVDFISCHYDDKIVVHFLSAFTITPKTIFSKLSQLTLSSSPSLSFLTSTSSCSSPECHICILERSNEEL